MRIAVSFLAATAMALTGLAACVGTPSADKVAAEVTAAGVCESLPAGVSCACVTTTAHSLIPTIKVERSKDDTGSRLGRGSVGQVDERMGPAIAEAREICATGKAVG
jgi:hypothetical protein